MQGRLKREYAIIGGGPAGAAAAYTLAKMGYNVVVYEANSRLAVKPCGYGIPSTSDIPFEIPKSSIAVRVKSVMLYVDGIPAVEIRDGIEGYIVDKREMLESLIIESGAELELRSRFNPLQAIVKSGGRIVDVRGGLLAGGVAFYPGETINAVETTLHNHKRQNNGVLEIYFDTSILGYYWIFPSPDGGVQVGVGGYAGPLELRERLEKFLSRNKMLPETANPRFRGAPIAVGGLALRRLNGNIVAIGEAAGFVLPLTGEGIRPSMLSGYYAAKAIVEGRDPLQTLEKIGIARAVRVQRRILERVKRMEPSRRREFLISIPKEVHIEVSLGTLRITRIIKALAGKPILASKLVRMIMGGEQD